MLKIIPIVIVLVIVSSVICPVFGQNETREEMLAWIAKLNKQDAELWEEMDRGTQVELNGITGERVKLWDSKTVLNKVAEWRIAHLKDEAQKELVRKAYQKALVHIKHIWDYWNEEPRGSGATTFAGSAAVALVKRQIDLWLLPDDEYARWMATWSNAKLYCQGREIQLTSGMGLAKLQKEDDEEIEFLLKYENCFTIDGEKYALVERNFIAAANDDFNRVSLYRLTSNGMAVLLEDVISGIIPGEMKLSKEREGCLRVDWKGLEKDEEDSTWVLLLK